MRKKNDNHEHFFSLPAWACSRRCKAIANGEYFLRERVSFSYAMADLSISHPAKKHHLQRGRE
jgi:hypothetical protein